MDDLISRQAAIDAIVQYLGRINRDFDNWKCTARIILDHVPSAQPEIIRCKACKWFGKAGCAIEIVDDSDKPTDDDFCSFAERRTDEWMGNS